MKKSIAFLVLAVLLASIFSGCKSNSQSQSASGVSNIALSPASSERVASSTSSLFIALYVT